MKRGKIVTHYTRAAREEFWNRPGTGFDRCPACRKDSERVRLRLVFLNVQYSAIVVERLLQWSREDRQGLKGVSNTLPGLNRIGHIAAFRQTEPPKQRSLQ